MSHTLQNHCLDSAGCLTYIHVLVSLDTVTHKQVPPTRVDRLSVSLMKDEFSASYTGLLLADDECHPYLVANRGPFP